MRQTTGRLRAVPHEGRVVVATRPPRGQSAASLLRTALTRSAPQAWQGDGGRWAGEVDHGDRNTRWRLAAFRVRAYEAVDT